MLLATLLSTTTAFASSSDSHDRQQLRFQSTICNIAQNALLREAPYLRDYSAQLSTPPPTPEQMTAAGADLSHIVTVQKAATRRMRVVKAPDGKQQIWTKYFPQQFTVLRLTTRVATLLTQQNYDEANKVAFQAHKKSLQRDRILKKVGLTSGACVPSR